MSLAPGTLLNERYRVVSILGQGGMGAVYRAKDEHLGVEVAIKENLFLTEGFSRQFQREATILASLRHPALPKVSDYFIIPNQGQYLIMEYIEGEDLRQRIERMGCLPDREVCVIGIVICDAIAYLHSRTQTVIHRDIKPGNIKITPEGEITLVDFGLAKVIEDKNQTERQETITGARAMTPGYSPPEQYGTARTDARSDIYALGATLYAAATGIIPEDGLSRMTGKVKLTPIRQLQPAMSNRVASIIEKALEIEPEDRFQEADEFRHALIASSELTFNTLARLTILPPPQNDGDESEQTVSVTQNRLIHPPSNKRNPKLSLSKTWLRFSPYGLLGLICVGFIVGGSWMLISNPGLLNSASPWLPLPTTALGATNYPSQPGSPQSSAMPTAIGINTETNQLTPLPVKETPVQVVIPSPAPTLSGRGNGQIAFVSDRTGTMQVWAMNPDGSNQSQLTNITEGACQPAFSPDGTKLAVISPCSEKKVTYNKTQILIMNSDGTHPDPLPIKEGGDFDPAWSHDGTRLAFSSIRNGIAHIFIYNFPSKTLEELSDTRYADINPSWSVGDKQIAVSRQITAAYHIWMISDKGLTQFQFSSNGEINDYGSDWSHNGEFLIFSRSSKDTNVPFLYRLDYKDRNNGGEIRILPSKNTLPISGARISLDDKWVVYESWPDGRNHDIFLMDITGDNFIRLTNDPGFDFNPVWIPNSPVK